MAYQEEDKKKKAAKDVAAAAAAAKAKAMAKSDSTYEAMMKARSEKQRMQADEVQRRLYTEKNKFK